MAAFNPGLAGIGTEIIDCAGILPERTVNGDVMLCTDPINAALVEGLPLIKVLSESLKEMTDSVVRERNAGVITADKWALRA